ncbi:galactose oxidase early set domain-containing protein [Nocardia vinacea]|uniref:galactose oxidase early set domain-containing protein n=1 Tax=Nocardia vinacea TaxID=96468 RepID=UPI002E156858|nr:galactose oxidase early set domain-containing protein [Nocardia vinacea]
MPWDPEPINSQILSVHAALVPGGMKGKVVMLGGSEHNPEQGGTDDQPADPDNVDRTVIYDVAARGDAVKIDSPTTDVFCSGHAFTADGRLLIAGGTESWGADGGDVGGPGGGHGHVHGNFGGHQACWMFNQDRETWDRVADLGFQVGPGKGGGRWYPTILTLPSGDLVAFGGHPSRRSEDWHENELPERYWSQANTWTWYPTPIHFEHPTLRGNWYPRATLVTGGLIFFTTKHNNECRLFDPNTGALTGPVMDPPGGMYDAGWDYSVIGLPLVPGDGYRTRVMAVNDVTPRFIELDLSAGASTPEWADAGDRTGTAEGKRRVFSCPVYLPTGQIFVSGGINDDLTPSGRDDDNAVKEPELFTPNIDWSNLEYRAGAVGEWDTIEEPAQKARNYHSVALLLPDGSVLVSGSNIDGQNGEPDETRAQLNIELYFPDYFDDPGRPTIATAPSLLTLDEADFTFTMGSAAEAASIRQVALIRCGSVTHAADFDQRFVALPFDVTAGTATITADLPRDASVLPPGYYMLWAVTEEGLPCETAQIVRVAHVSCDVVLDRSRFSEEEVLSFAPADADFPFAIYAMFDGYLAGELPTSLIPELEWADTNTPVAMSDIALTQEGGRWLEHLGRPEAAQRVTYPFTVEIRNPDIFDTFADKRTIRVTFRHETTSCTARFDLVKSPNPYMVDIDPVARNPHWLSTDIRTFRVRAGQMLLGDYDLTQGTGAGAPETFAKALIDKFRELPNDRAHPFYDLPTEGDAAAVDLAPFEGSARVYNYAVAKVRYRAVTTEATHVKVFFRLCTTAATGLEYNTDGVYRNTGTSADPVPALGLAGDEVASIPFFLSQRKNTVNGQAGATTMADQELAEHYEFQDIDPTAGQEVTAYFACWLDINEPDVKRFPLTPGTEHGPWADASAQPIQEFFRSPHQCLVAEIFFADDETNTGDTPGNSDNLSQRNLVLLHSDNPGAPFSHHVVHPFEVKPSAFRTFPDRVRPDELIVNWHNLPRASEVTLYFSNIDTRDIAGLAAFFRNSPAPFTVLDDKTLKCTVANHTWIPIPGGTGTNIPALLSVHLPDTVQSGELYRISIHQVEGASRRVIGSIAFDIPVSKAELLLDRELRTLSIMKHIGQTIPSTNRWYPIFLRYLAFLAARVDGLGGDSTTVHANPDGSGRPVRPKHPEHPCFDGDQLTDTFAKCCTSIAKVLCSIPPACVVSRLCRRRKRESCQTRPG